MKYPLFIAVILHCFLCSAQGWQRKFHIQGTHENYTKAIYETANGNYIGLGLVADTSNGYLINKLYIIGLNSQGQLLWTKNYGNSLFYYYDNSLINSWVYKKNNYFYFTGGVKHGNKNNSVLIKFNSNGDTLWQKEYSDSSGDICLQRVTSSVDGGLLLTGFFQNSSIRPCIVIKTDINGNELWRKIIHKNVPDVSTGKAIVQDSTTKQIIIAGDQYIGNANYWKDCDHILVLDSLGNKIKQSSMWPMGGGIYDLIQTKDKKFVAIGAKTYSVDSYNADIRRAYMAKFDTLDPSSPIWVKENDSDKEDSGYSSVVELANENLVVAGYYDTMIYYELPQNLLACIEKFDKQGNVLQKRKYDYKYNGIGDDNGMIMRCLNPTSGGGFISAIQTFYYSPDRFFFVKYDSTGCDSSLAYCAIIATGIQNNVVNSRNINIYPNPAATQMQIDVGSFGAQEHLFVSFVDLYGREVRRVKLEAANSLHDLKGLADGLYVLQISDGTGSRLYQSKFIKQQ